MADNTTTSQADFLRMAKGPINVNYPKLAPLLGLIKRDTARRNFVGTDIRVPQRLSLMPHAGLVAQGGTVNEPGPATSTQAYIKVCRLVQPMGITDELEHDSSDSDASWRDAQGQLIEEATDAHGRVANMLYNGDGTARIAEVTATNTTTTVAVGTTANFYSLQPDVYVDIRVRSTLAVISGGLRRRITAVSETAGTITVDTAVSTDNTMGVYLEGSAGDPVGLQGLEAAFAQSGTFENISRSTYPQWMAVDGRNGDTTATDLSEPIMDGAVRRVMKKAGKQPDWWLGDPAVIDRYAQTHLTLQRFPGEARVLDTGYMGVKYRTKDLYWDYDHPQGSLKGIDKAALTVYSATSAPDWYTFPNGQMWDNFGRSFAKEAWLHDRMNIGYHRLNSFVYVANLNGAS